MADTRFCVTVIISGVPVGAHSDELDCTTSGCPLERTRVVPASQVADVQGPFAVLGGGNVQPATV